MKEAGSSGERRRLLIYEGGVLTQGEDRLVREIPLEVWFNGDRWITIACAGLHVEELALGFLRSEGLLQAGGDLAEVVVSTDGRRVCVRTVEGRTVLRPPGGRTLASSGACSVRGERPMAPPALEGKGLQVKPAEILVLMARFLERARLHAETGGSHAAALVQGGEILVVREDIGRHNVIDMLGGYALIKGIDCRETLILRTGRISAEIVQKVHRLGAPLVTSLSVPTVAAVRAAQQAGITLIGSVRGDRMKIYSQEGRVRC